MDCSEWKFDKKTPIYIQLYQKIKYGILSGQLPPGKTVPSIRQMAAILHINTNTAARTYNLLSQDGLLVMPRGRKCRITSDSDYIYEKCIQEVTTLCDTYIRTMGELGFSREEARTFVEKIIYSESHHQ